MDKNNKSCKSMSLCERLFRGVKASPSFRKFGRRSSGSTQGSSLQTSSFVQSNPFPPKQSNPIELVLEGSPSNTPMTHHKTNKKPKPWTEMTEVVHGTRVSDQKSNHDDINERFNEFIDRARRKIMSVSNAGAGKSSLPARTDSVDGKASEYINRARVRIRTTSSNLGNGRS